MKSNSAAFKQKAVPSRSVQESLTVKHLLEVDLKNILALGAFSLIVNGIFLYFTKKISGDAVQYSILAEGIAGGEFETLNTFWLNLFSYWQAIFNYLGFQKIDAAILSSFLPGLLLFVPLYIGARILTGRRGAVLASIFLISHPRLLEYSANGYAETFYLFMLFTSIALLLSTFHVTRYYQLLLVLAGIFWGAYFCTRNEAIIWLFSLIGVLLVHAWKEKRLKKSLKDTFLLLLGFSLFSLAFATLGGLTVNSPLMFSKKSNLSKVYDEELNPEMASATIYPVDEREFKKIGGLESLYNLLSRYPLQLQLLAKKVPTVLASPLFLFAIYFLYLGLRKKEWNKSYSILLLAIAFPIGFYPIIHVEPRYFFPILYPICIFGTDGLLSLPMLVGAARMKVLVIAVFLIVSLQLSIAGYQSQRIRGKYLQHEMLAAWLKANVPSDSVVTGDGFGYVAATTYLSGHRHLNRVVSEDIRDIEKFMEKHDSHHLVVYADFLEKYNPYHKNFLTETPHGFQLLYTLKQEGRRRARIFLAE